MFDADEDAETQGNTGQVTAWASPDKSSVTNDRVVGTWQDLRVPA